MAKYYRVVECLNVVWECEATSEKEARQKYLDHTYDTKNYMKLVNEGESDIEVTRIDEDGNCIDS